MQIFNRTPHKITIYPDGDASQKPTVEIPAANRGEVARVTESVDSYSTIISTPRGDVPITSTTWGRIFGLPALVPGVMHVVSVVVAAAAHASSRGAEDLLVPGQQVRNEHNQIVGCASLVRARHALPGYYLSSLPPVEAERAWERKCNLLALPEIQPGPVNGETDLPVGTRCRFAFPTSETAYLCRDHDGEYYLVHWGYGEQGWLLDRMSIDGVRLEMGWRKAIVVDEKPDGAS